MGMATKTLDQYIEIAPGIAGGKPRIAGHRVTLQNIVLWHERMGKSVDDIASEYDLALADVYAALTYYFDHRHPVGLGDPGEERRVLLLGAKPDDGGREGIR